MLILIKLINGIINYTIVINQMKLNLIIKLMSKIDYQIMIKFSQMKKNFFKIRKKNLIYKL